MGTTRCSTISGRRTEASEVPSTSPFSSATGDEASSCSPGFRRVADRANGYLFGSYLLSPREKTDVTSPYPDVVLSVPDVYTARAGMAYALSHRHGLSVSLGARLDGIPLRDRILLLTFETESLKPLTGKTLAEVARIRGKSPGETAIDLVVQDGSRVEVAYFLMSEENIRKQIAQPWVSFGSDSESSAPEGVFLQWSTHPRAYGNFAHLLGHYVREEHVISLAEAIRRLTLLPATTLGLKRRGALKPGYFADVAVFDSATIGDRATYQQPRQYASGMVHVLVNGVPVLRDGSHTGATPGRIIRGPGWRFDSTPTGHKAMESRPRTGR